MKMDSNGNSWIAISEFHQQSYCEVQLEFKWKGIRVETEAMKKGTKIHDQKFKTFEEETKGLEEVDIVNASRGLSKRRRSSQEGRSSLFHLPSGCSV